MPENIQRIQSLDLVNLSVAWPWVSGVAEMAKTTKTAKDSQILLEGPKICNNFLNSQGPKMSSACCGGCGEMGRAARLFSLHCKDHESFSSKSQSRHSL